MINFFLFFFTFLFFFQIFGVLKFERKICKIINRKFLLIESLQNISRIRIEILRSIERFFKRKFFLKNRRIFGFCDFFVEFEGFFYLFFNVRLLQINQTCFFCFFLLKIFLKFRKKFQKIQNFFILPWVTVALIPIWVKGQDR